MKKAIKITENVYWIGVHDFNSRHFHGHIFPISEGTSYNAYLIIDDQITVIDTVEMEFTDIMFERIQSVIGNKQVDNLIIQHAEPDHSGGFNLFMNKYPNVKLYASNAGINSMMKQYFGLHKWNKVKTQDTITTGKFHLSFIEMPLIHWPDNMMTYLNEDKILFSNDAFGQHIVSYQIFDKFHHKEKCLELAKDYYANIIMPYSDKVEKKLIELHSLHLDISMICPSHGIILQDYVSDIFNLYTDLATFKSKNKIVIIYDSVWNHTQQIAESLAEGIGRNGVCVKVYKASCTSNSIIQKEIIDCKAILIGSGCYDNSISTNISALLEKLKISHLKGKYGLGFGSYGWYKNAISLINDKLVEANITLLKDQAICQNYTPNKDDLENYINIGEQIANQIKTL